MARICTKVPTNPDKVQGDKHVSTAMWPSASQLVNPVIDERGYRGLHVEIQDGKHCLLSDHHGTSQRVVMKWEHFMCVAVNRWILRRYTNGRSRANPNQSIHSISLDFPADEGVRLLT